MEKIISRVLILVVMEDGLVLSATEQPMPGDPMVLILVVMEDGLVQVLRQVNQMTSKCLNPCCNGRWSRTIVEINVRNVPEVLILVVMEDGLVRDGSKAVTKGERS